MSKRNELVLVLDFGCQYKELIAHAVRGLSVYAEIHAGALSADEIKRLNPIGIILSGGPGSVYDSQAPLCDPAVFALGIPVLGICYGMQMICHMLGGEVVAAPVGEFGRITMTPEASEGNASRLLDEVQEPSVVMMSHRDMVARLPEGFRVTAKSPTCIAACEDATRNLYGVQFHPETKHTVHGQEIIRNFLYNICGASGDYRLDDVIDEQIEQIRRQVGSEQVLLALSGGVDSSVCASLLSKAVPDQLTCIFIDHGLMRQHEGDEIEEVFSQRDVRFIRVNAEERFLARLKGVTDPETKRMRIGEEFIRVLEGEARKLGDIPFLAQGTIYSDVIESSCSDESATIKSHHNVGGLPEKLAFTGIVEPLAGLFKNEVRTLGEKLGLPPSLIHRQPFPGPGLAVRIMGEVTAEKLDILRAADAILREELDGIAGTDTASGGAANLSTLKPDQYFVVLTDTCSTGVKGSDRTYDKVVAIRAVTTDDFMTCEYAELPHDVLRRISSRITGEVPAISRVVYDITSKPPATVEWE
ncbi:MAG: glutamine-hydrolyzing GMP synthase [Coriobacteriia bacterium]|nr:glutamine-hydrolyzing GMP synthase [Coriobacteriia bacterium]